MSESIFGPDGLLKGVTLLRRGKVRDTYLFEEDPTVMLVVASDRISVFDFVLSAFVLGKGEILTAMNIFWRRLFASGYDHDLLAFGSGIDQYIPDRCAHLRNQPELQCRSVIVRRVEMLPIECIVRGYLTGSGLTAYNETGKVCGHILPSGLRDGSELPIPIFTPTTKAEVGHDEHMDAEAVLNQYGPEVELTSLRVYDQARAYAVERGVIVADTKFELGKKGELADEILTPDSSRFWDIDQWGVAMAQGQTPPAWDKQFVREHAKKLGINKRDPKKQADYDWVRTQVIDPSCLAQTSEIYHAIFRRLVKTDLLTFQREVMKIAA